MITIETQDNFAIINVARIHPNPIVLLKETFLWLENSRVNKIPDKIFEKIEKQPVGPKHLIFLEFKKGLVENKNQKQKGLDLLSKIYLKYQDTFKDLYLIGQDWLQFDTDTVVKTDGEIDFIAINKLPLKVVSKSYKENLKIELENNILWIWRLSL
jgi:hypothetical protein